jgi:thiamine-monophosphate kinase
MNNPYQDKRYLRKDLNMFHAPDLTPISAIGEFGLIEKIQTMLPTTATVMGDDCAVLGDGPIKTLVTKDLLLEGVHFDLTYVPPKHLGYKAAMVNLSDIAAMNGTPKYLMLGLGVPAQFSVEAIEEFLLGFQLACSAYQVQLIGGDTTRSKAGLHISITAIGEAAADQVVYRSGAKPNELICVTGSLGSACAGFMVLDREQKIFKENPGVQPDLEAHALIIERQLKPEARFDILYALRQNQLQPTSMIDVSDGLAPELLHLCKASTLGCRIDAARIPIDQGVYHLAEEMNLDPYQLALYGGEDYELLFTLPATAHTQVSLIPDIRIIGYTTDEPGACYLVDDKNQMHPLETAGWDSLKGTGMAGTKSHS